MTAAPSFGSDLLVERLARLGVAHVALNPGASIRGFHDSLVNAPGPTPDLVLALHEEIAVAMAHGYAKAGGGTMAVGVHDTVGLLHASMAIFNAWADRIPLLLFVGTGPLDAARRRPWIDWIHTVTDQGALVRDFTVWNDQPTSLEALLASTDRAWTAIHRGPLGPGLIALDVDIQEAPADRAAHESRLLAAPTLPSRAAPDPLLVEAIVRDLRAARAPVFVTDRPLSAAASARLVELATRVGAGLLEVGGGVSFAVGHPHDVTEGAEAAMTAADHLLLVDVSDPAWALGSVDLGSRQSPDRLAGHAGGQHRPRRHHGHDLDGARVARAGPPGAHQRPGAGAGCAAGGVGPDAPRAGAGPGEGRRDRTARACRMP